MKYFKIYLIIYIVAGIFSPVFGQYSLSGPTSALTGETHTYTANGSDIAYLIWTGSNGVTISNQSGNNANYTFNNSGDTFVWCQIGDEFNNTYNIKKKVTVCNVLSPGSIEPNQTICYSGDPGTINSSAVASGGDGSFVYQWQYSNDGSSGWTNISGATGTTYNPPGGLTASRWYRRRVQSCSQTKYTGSRKVTVNPDLSAGVIGPGQNVCYNGNPVNIRNLTLPSGGDGSYIYQWQFSENGTSGWTNISGANNLEYDPPAGLIADRWYRREVQSCTQTKYSSSAKATVYPTLTSGSINGIQNVCYNGNPGTLGNASSPTGGNGSYLYQWQFSENGSSGWANISGANSASYDPPGGLIADRWYRREVSSCGQTLNSGSIKVTVYSPLSSGSISGDQTIDYNGDPEIITTTAPASGANGNYTYQWEYAVGGSSTWTPITLATDLSYDPPANLLETTSYRRKVSSCNGSVFTNSVTIVVMRYWYADFENDGFGDPGSRVYQELQPDGYVANNTDLCPGFPGMNDGCGYVSPAFSDENYIYSRVYQYPIQDASFGISENNHVLENLVYYDALGRPMQEINLKATPQGEDLIKYVGYDEYGRKVKDFLPYPSTGTTGNFRNTSESDTDAFYSVSFPNDLDLNDLNPFSQDSIEPSPLNRKHFSAFPGVDWKLGSGHEIEFNYDTNSTNEVRLFRVEFTGGNTQLPELIEDVPGYSSGELFKQITRDENHDGTSSKDHSTEEFIDKQGRTLLKRTYEGNIAHDTYYVYDDYGNLTFVLPPKANPSDGISTIELNELCFQYIYDHRNRLIEKKLPGKDWEYIVYNKMNQPIMTQDANLNALDHWLFTKYDALGRVIYTGLQTSNSSNRSTVQSNANTVYDQYEIRSTANIYNNDTVYYSNTSFPASINEVYTINYYDTYEDTNGLVVPSNVFGIPTITETQGMLTVSKVKVLGTNDWITTIQGYDEKGRIIYSASKNNYLNTTDIIENKLDFVGKVVRSKITHIRSGNEAIVTEDVYEYDHQGRLLAHNNIIDGKTQTIVQNVYNTLGELQSKKVGGLAEYSMPVLVDQTQITTDNNLISTSSSLSGWNTSGFASAKYIQGDGYVEWKASNDNKNIMVGLSVDNPDAHYNTINFALYTQYQGEVRVYEDGTNKGTFGTYSAGDLFRVERYGETVRYLHNNEVIYTSSVPNNQPLLVDAAFYHTGGAIADLLVMDSDEVVKAKPLQTVDFDYNIRGWLKGINDPTNLNDDLFAFGINYNTQLHNGTPLFNGNIAETEWITASDNSLRWYRYDYDALNRITEAIANTANYNLSNVLYDKNGNIQSLTRNGWQDNNGTIEYTNMDVLTYMYAEGEISNRLVRVSDTGSPEYGFVDGNILGDDYGYDSNGNMTSDLNKGINANSISYNHLNLPEEISVSSTENTGTITYIYDATGVKIQKIVNETGQGSVTTDYVNNYIYQNGTLQFFNQPEGYTTISGNGDYEYVYQYKDHLGNIRLSYTDISIDEQDFFVMDTEGWTTPGTGTIANTNEKLNISIANKWNSSSKYFNITPGKPIHIEFDFENGDMVTPNFFVRERINGVWESTGDRDVIANVGDGHHELDLILTGDYIRIYFEKGGASDDGILTTCYVDNIKVHQQQLEIVEENNYYPFGLTHNGYNGNVSPLGNSVAKKFQYNSQELDESLGLNVVEMSFRHYDPAIGRFIGMDRFTMLAPGITPYRFAFNNPIFWSDPSGLYEVDEDGNIVITNSIEIENLLNFLNDNEGASVAEISEHIFTSEEFGMDLDGVTVTAGSPSSRFLALNRIGNQVQLGLNSISNFNGNIKVDGLTNANSGTAIGIDFAGSALTGAGTFANPASVAGVAMMAQINGSNLSNTSLNNLTRINQIAKPARFLGMAAPLVNTGIAVYNINNAYKLDGRTFGYNSTITTSRSAGSIVVGWAGAEAGAAAGAALGVWFGGVGAVPGAIIGGIVGGVIGSYAGAEAGEAFGEQITN